LDQFITFQYKTRPSATAHNMLSTTHFFVAQLHSISLIIETYVRHLLISYNSLFVVSESH